MDIKETVKQFSDKVAASPEFVAFKKINDILDRDPKLKSQVEQFFKESAEMQERRQKGEKLPMTPEEMNQRFNRLMENKEIEKYFAERQKFHLFMAEIHEIIDENICDCLEK